MNTHNIYGYLNAFLYSVTHKKLCDGVDNCLDILTYFGESQKSPSFKAKAADTTK